MQPETVFRFSTDSVPTRDRAAVWHEVICRQYMCLDVEADKSTELRAELKVHNLPATMVSFLRATPTKYLRTKTHAQKGDPDFTFIRSPKGGFTFTSPTEEASFSFGEGVLLPNNGIGTVAVRHQNQFMTVRINGAMMRAALRDIDERLVSRLAVANESYRLASSYIEALLRDGITEPAVGHLAHAHIVDLLAFGLRPTAEARARVAGGAVPAARLAAIRADIAVNLGETRLSAKSVAVRHNVSERYVHLLFEQSGMSFARFVTEQRLKAAMILLLDPARVEMRISDIAYTVGFGELTTFNRAFRARFGATPSDIRATAIKSSRD